MADWVLRGRICHPGRHADQRLPAAFGCDRAHRALNFPALTLAVVGADYPNKGKSPPRRFEIPICRPGERVELIPEPKNPADEHAIAVFSCRGIQIGYITAERAPMIGKRMRDGCDVVAVFQAPASFGAYVRASFDGTEPALPAPTEAESQSEDDEFWPDPIWPDE